MSYIIAKSKRKLIKILKRTGDEVIVLKCDVVFAFPKSMGIHKNRRKELKKHPKRFSYYNSGMFGKRVKKK